MNTRILADETDIGKEVLFTNNPFEKEYALFLQGILFYVDKEKSQFLMGIPESMDSFGGFRSFFRFTYAFKIEEDNK